MFNLVQLSSLLSTIIMRHISVAQHSSVVSLLNEGFSHHQIQARTGLGKGTVGRISKEVEGNKENHLGGHPSKLSVHDKQAIIRQITTGKFDNAVQATQFINSIISNPVSYCQKIIEGGWSSLSNKEESPHVKGCSSCTQAHVCKIP